MIKCMFIDFLIEYICPLNWKAYYLQQDRWHSMQDTPTKAPLDTLKYILKCDKWDNLATIADQTHQLQKWHVNKCIQKPLLNNFFFWKNPVISYK